MMNKKSCTENSHFLITKSQTHYTDNNGYSGDRYSGNDGYSGLNPPDDAILFTVCGITAIADKKLEILIKKYRLFDLKCSVKLSRI